MDNSIIADVISSSNDRKIIGKIRLQKIFYLLEQLGLNARFSYSYHHYGPYSEDLSNAVAFAKDFDESVVESEATSALGHKYSVFSLSDKTTRQISSTIGDLSSENVRKYVNLLEEPTSVVIELAATIHWLREKEQVADWESELKSRKTTKATDDNIRKAKDLLSKINLFE